jgi:molecular chaperone GrpE (heat shock protein)
MKENDEAGAVPDVSAAEAAGSFEELADDVLLLRMVRELQQVQRQQAAELYSLRRDLLEDRRAQANRSAFDAVHPAIDQIELMQATLPESESDAARHVSVLLSSLRMVLRRLGFVPFTVDVGDPFDPARMECVEYAEGEQGVVLAVLRAGYRADGVVVRPCGVAIAQPAAVSSGLERELEGGT